MPPLNTASHFTEEKREGVGMDTMSGMEIGAMPACHGEQIPTPADRPPFAVRLLVLIDA